MSTEPHDGLIQRALSSPEQAGPYLASVLPAELVASLDLETLELRDRGFIDPAFGKRQADFLYQVSFVGGGKALLYVLLEAQRCVDPLMAARLYVYTARVLDKWLRKNPGARRVPPILPVVLYNGRPAWTAPTTLRELFWLPDPSVSREHFPQLSYRVDDLRRSEDEALERRSLPPFGRVALLLLRHCDDAEDDFLVFLTRLAAAINEVEDRDDLISCFTYIVEAGPGGAEALDALRPRLSPPKEEVAMTIADALHERGRKEGLEQGLEQGREENRGSVQMALEAILRLRFQLSDEDLSRLRDGHLASGTAVQLQQWVERATRVEGLDDVFAD